MSARSRRTLSLWAVAASLAGAALGGWLIMPPSGIGAYAAGAPTNWAKLQQVRQDDPRLRLRHTYVPISAVSTELQLAVVVGEDTGYLGHGAFDLGAIHEALDDWRLHGHLRGASTLSQQLAKNLFLSGDRSLWRKLREARYAYWMEDRLGKRRIFELYLNIVELGDGVFGVESGARHYFGVSAAELSGEQAAELAAAIPSPLGNNPDTRTAAWHGRYRAIRERMHHFGWLRDRLAAMSGSPTRSHPTETDANTDPQLPPAAGAGAGAGAGAAESGAGTAGPDAF